MNKEFLSWNIYVNVNSMYSLERDFYNIYYKYRRFCYTSSKTKGDFRKTKAYTELLNKLNYAYEKIFDCSNKEKNEFGEYEYPKVAYKLKSYTVGGKKTNVLYACISDTNCTRKVKIEHLFDILPLYFDGSLKTVEPSNEDTIENLIIESNIKNVVSTFKKYCGNLSSFCNAQKTYNYLQKLCDFPVDSITELNFNNLFSKKDYEISKKSFFVDIEDNVANIS